MSAVLHVSDVIGQVMEYLQVMTHSLTSQRLVESPKSILLP